MFDGNTFLGATGMPRRAMALVRTRFEDWLPEPLTVATRIVKSLTARADIGMDLIRLERVRTFPRASLIVRRVRCTFAPRISLDSSSVSHRRNTAASPR